MKNVLKLLWISLLLESVTLQVYAQEQEKCKLFSEQLVTAINQKNVENLTEWLSDDFTILNQKGVIAQKVLDMLITQSINDTVLNYSEKDAQKNGNTLTLKYDFEYEQKGNQEITIVFDASNKVSSLSLIKAEVKVMMAEDKMQVKNNSSESYQQIPFELKGNLIIVNAVVNNEKQQFIFDSGSSRTILNSAYQNSKVNSVSSAKGINSNINNQDIIEIPKIEFGKLLVENERVLVSDLSHLEKETKTKIYGIIGTDFINQLDIMYDYAQKQLMLITPDQFETLQTTHLSETEFQTFPMTTLLGHLPIVTLSINGRKYNVAIDSGAGANAFSTSLFEELKPVLRGVKTTELQGLSGKVKEVQKGKMKKCMLGDVMYKSTPTVFTDLGHLDAFKEVNISGIIGYEILSKQKFIISYQRKEILIEQQNL
ncbi:retroviral-like aspartic protease family protein [Flammeovirga sp. SJP92]|uniref:retroviral-like aspartic protease family protein n=1 Tax=Flammeovirga sp. SJP92 TaxID=1775430 RepID=UPI000788C9D0|nr:retroviral-like aspartic protease family protein [Flammeovirga sp. SJP92]KXX67922.1 hypothetical protein AVL50_23990 [Flammeovirga sp. SJP92]